MKSTEGLRLQTVKIKVSSKDFKEIIGAWEINLVYNKQLLNKKILLIF